MVKIKKTNLIAAFVFTIYFAAMFVIAITLAHGRATRRYEPAPTPVASPAPVDEKTNITFSCENCGPQEAAMVPKMQELLNRVTRTQCFADRFTLSAYRSKLEQTHGLTREQVVETIRTARVHVPLFFYYPTWLQSKNVIGYTTADDDTVYLNRLFRQRKDWTMCSEVSNSLHEATHKMIKDAEGTAVAFDHDYEATARRPYSVPYTANFAVDECCDALLSGQTK